MSKLHIYLNKCEVLSTYCAQISKLNALSDENVITYLCIFCIQYCRSVEVFNDDAEEGPY